MTLETLEYYLSDMRARAPHTSAGLEVRVEGNTVRIVDRLHPCTVALVDMGENRVFCKSGRNAIPVRRWRNAFLDAPQGMLLRDAVYVVDGGKYVFRTDTRGRVVRINARLNSRLAGDVGMPTESIVTDCALMQGFGAFGPFRGPEESVNLFRVDGEGVRRLVRSMEEALSGDILSLSAFRLTWRTDIRYPAPSVTRPEEFRFRAVLQSGPHARIHARLDCAVKNGRP